MGLTQAIAQTIVSNIETHSNHLEALKIFAEDGKIQYFSKRRQKWITVTSPKFTTNYEYRKVPKATTLTMTIAFNGYSKSFVVDKENKLALEEYLNDLNLTLEDFESAVGVPGETLPRFTLVASDGE